MLDKNKVNRRKLLTATATTSSALLGVPVVSAQETDNISGTDAKEMPTKAEVEQALSEMEVRVDKEASDNPSTPNSVLDSNSSNSTGDVKIYVGKYKNAETLTGETYAIETRAEYYNRNASPGFDTTEASTSSAVSAQSLGIPDTYVTKDAVDATISGVGVDVDVGLGVKLTSSFTGVAAALTLDIHVNGVTLTVFSQSYGIGVNKNGLCFKPIKAGWSALPNFTVRPCVNLSLSKVSGSYKVKVGGSIKACAHPCGPFSCPICHSGGFSFDPTLAL